MGLTAVDTLKLKGKLALCVTDTGTKKLLSELIDALSITAVADADGGEFEGCSGLTEADLALASVQTMTFVDGCLQSYTTGT